MKRINKFGGNKMEEENNEVDFWGIDDSKYEDVEDDEEENED